LRAPWIMEKDDFKYTLSFGKDVFGGPRWRDLVGNELADKYQAKGTVPIMLDPKGKPVLRNFVHVDDLVEAILKAMTWWRRFSKPWSIPNSRHPVFHLLVRAEGDSSQRKSGWIPKS